MTNLISERGRALILAAAILDNPRRDPDDDLAVLSRQLTRAQEQIDALASRSPAPADRLKIVTDAIMKQHRLYSLATFPDEVAAAGSAEFNAAMETYRPYAEKDAAAVLAALPPAGRAEIVEECAKVAKNEATYQAEQFKDDPVRHEYGQFVAERIEARIRSLASEARQ